MELLSKSALNNPAGSGKIQATGLIYEPGIYTLVVMK